MYVLDDQISSFFDLSIFYFNFSWNGIGRKFFFQNYMGPLPSAVSLLHPYTENHYAFKAS